MKRVIINAYQVGLVFKKNEYKRMLKEGTYWFWNEDVFVYDVTKPFVPLIELSILLQDEASKDALIVVDVKDNEIVLQYENGLLKQVLAAGAICFLEKRCSV